MPERHRRIKSIVVLEGVVVVSPLNSVVGYVELTYPIPERAYARCSVVHLNNVRAVNRDRGVHAIVVREGVVVVSPLNGVASCVDLTDAHPERAYARYCIVDLNNVRAVNRDRGVHALVVLEGVVVVSPPNGVASCVDLTDAHPERAYARYCIVNLNNSPARDRDRGVQAVVVRDVVSPLNGVVGCVDLADPIPERAHSVPPVVNLHDG